MMIKITIFIFLLLMTSCNSNEKKLIDEISKLRSENKKLINEVNECKLEKIANLQITLDPGFLTSDVNQNNMIKGKFIQYAKMPNYDLYLTNQRTKERKLLRKNQVEPNFEFNYKPASKNDTLIKISAEMTMEDKTVITLLRELKLTVK